MEDNDERAVCGAMIMIVAGGGEPFLAEMPETLMNELFTDRHPFGQEIVIFALDMPSISVVCREEDHLRHLLNRVADVARIEPEAGSVRLYRQTGFSRREFPHMQDYRRPSHGSPKPYRAHSHRRGKRHH